MGKKWHNRGYYGSVNHNAKAVYQRYLGWYDSNPANLYKLPPVEAAKRYVEFMGGADAVIAKAKESFEKGDYRWVAEVMNQVVFADPHNAAAKALAADALEQLGYQAEDPTWRNEFLTGAQELRHGVLKLKDVGVASPDSVQAMTPDMLLDYMGIRLNGVKADSKTLNMIWKQPDTGESYALELRNSVLIYTKDKPLQNTDGTLTVTRSTLAAIIMGGSTLDKELASGGAKVEGSTEKVGTLFAMLDPFEFMFNIVTP